MKKGWETRDVLLFLIFIMLIINCLQNLPVRKLSAETFRVDDCITAQPKDKPAAYGFGYMESQTIALPAYLHVVTH